MDTPDLSATCCLISVNVQFVLRTHQWSSVIMVRERWLLRRRRARCPQSFVRVRRSLRRFFGPSVSRGTRTPQAPAPHAPPAPPAPAAAAASASREWTLWWTLAVNSVSSRMNSVIEHIFWLHGLPPLLLVRNLMNLWVRQDKTVSVIKALLPADCCAHVIIWSTNWVFVPIPVEVIGSIRIHVCISDLVLPTRKSLMSIPISKSAMIINQQRGWTKGGLRGITCMRMYTVLSHAMIRFKAWPRESHTTWTWWKCQLFGHSLQNYVWKLLQN